ncbi:hypothetical protein ALP12_102204 [Pseudomonas savastanoi pv. phaseolicola]|uniref:Uncharacterized protein n=3 Tax=Pseudomonas syringae group genomosp. 2 TaxID=251698 RepID=A0AAX1VP86_PSEAJ|nr:hypothetical protein ALO55_102647 [Pseudomonas savastanoi pv. phaseolicola]RML76510.1 hypothetical protein ALQ89_100671 [Pseudomonas amygdali pv. tabaci]RMN45157.1 hypothetical protein ALQ60_101679 [Pseudomonas syringae pv. papulans]RMQ34648.1 hypothetical protein ALQ05_101948 [Pseudomonas amygdali pv. mori]RMQ66258.1 hypothetical protein ALQ01_102761 [Pseudomonas savastanoi pv. glycinea]RMT04397.1 hypothetical protein ALP54_102201 [Pseudomonas amygdali pv. lachrymans]RMU05486.1 hypothetic
MDKLRILMIGIPCIIFFLLMTPIRATRDSEPFKHLGAS